MSKSVISSIKTRTGAFTDNVKEVITTTTEVAEQSDLNILEARLNKRIETLECSINKLNTLLENISSKHEELPLEIKKEILLAFKSQQNIVTEEYQKIINDMSDKCFKISKILK